MVPGRTRREGVAAITKIVAAALVLTLAICGAVLAAEPPQYFGSFGPDGTEATDFESVGPVAVDEGTGSVYVGDPTKQVLYKFDEAGTPVSWGGSAGYISGSEISGVGLGGNLKNQAAVDSETHVVYVTDGNAVRAFEANGEPHEFTAGLSAGTSELLGAEELTGVAVDNHGDIYASDFLGGPNFIGKIRIYSRSGELLTEFKTTFDPTNLAVDPNGTLYATEFLSSVVKLVPSEFPVAATTKYANVGRVDEQVSYSVAVDPATSFVYVGESGPGGHLRVAVYSDTGEFIGSLGDDGHSGELAGTPEGLAVNGAEERTYVADRKESAPTAAKVKIFGTYFFTVSSPTVTGTAATELTATSARLRGQINPNTLETTYRFEYGTRDCSSAPGVCSIASEGVIEAGHEQVPVSALVTGLAPNTRYFFRLVARNALDVTEGPTRILKTQGSGPNLELPDRRVWEQVSPKEKLGGVITNGALVQAAGDGSGIAFMSRGSIFSAPEGNRALEPSAVLAQRSGGGWQAQDLVPPHTEATGFGPGPEYKLFSDDLQRAVLEPRDETALSPEASERTPYLRTNTNPPSYRPLVTAKEGFANVPEGTVFSEEANGDRNPVSFSGGNESLDHLVVSSKAPLVLGAPTRAIYMWVDGQLEPVSELPADEGGELVLGKLGSGLITVRHAVSADGSRVFWSPGEIGGGTLEIPALYLRDTVAEESVRLDVVQADASGSEEPSPVFMGASSDGTYIFFTDGQQLTKDASPTGRDLYRCTIGEVGGSLGCTSITDLSSPRAVAGESAEVQELALGISEDGTRLYFVANGILATNENGAGETAVSGSPNLYAWHEGEGVRFIAPLSLRDSADWGQPGKPGAVPVGHSSRQAAASSPNGQYLAFMADRKLTGSESDDPETGEPVEEAFLYNANSDRLVCVSCNPNGATDAGHLIASGESEGGGVFPDVQGLWSGRWVGATLPEGTESEPTIGYGFYRPRGVLDNGRVFFNSIAPLVRADSNSTWDAYQYEPLGVGTCTSALENASNAVTEAGCIGLLSSGTDAEPSVFLDASESGDDAFILTSARLSALDTDNVPDVYDAKVGGVTAAAGQHPDCEGEACRGASSAPVGTLPGSETFNGPGNVTANPGKRCRRGEHKVRRKGKVVCKKKQGRHRGKSHATAGGKK